MAKKKGDKNITPAQKEAIKSIIAPRFKFRDTNNEMLELLEDNKIEISECTLINIKNEMRKNLGDRLKRIGEYELTETHTETLDVMDVLLKTMLESLKFPKDESERARIVSEIRAILKDRLEYYGNTEVVDAVFEHFKREDDIKKEEKIKKVKT